MRLSNTEVSQISFRSIQGLPPREQVLPADSAPPPSLCSPLSSAVNPGSDTEVPSATSAAKMYGLYLEAVNDYINESYGEDVWRLIENRAEIPHLKFVRHQMYK